MKLRKLIIGLMAILPMGAMAKLVQPCDSFSTVWKDTLPAHYCDCEYNSNTFAFPIDTVLSGDVWFTATIDDIRQGISAYWFSNTSVTIDVYAFCISTTPTFSVTVGPNRMSEMDMDKINSKLDEIGGSAQYLKALTPRIHVYPLNGGSGQVYCYPYDQGPHSTCDRALEMRAWMTYVCSEPENVYRLPSSNIPASGHAFLRWIHKPKNVSQKPQPAEIWLTMDSCNGAEVARVTMSDTTHVYQPDSALLVTARNAKREIWVHVSHEAGVNGRLFYYTNPKYADPLPPVNQTICEGKKITVDGRDYTSDTAFVDVICMSRDTLQERSVSLSFTPPTTIYDTVQVAAAELARGYVHPASGMVLRQFGDTVFDIVKANTCTKRFQVTVEEKEEPKGTELISGAKKARKTIVNGQMVIYIDEKKYNVLGQQIQ